MRKIEAQMIQAIRALMGNAEHEGSFWRCGNMSVGQVHDGLMWTPSHWRGIEVRLYGDLIATVEPGLNRMWADDCGFKTATTKSRLNALLAAFVPGERITQVKGEWQTSDGEWPGSDEWAIRLSADNWVLQQVERLAS